MSLLRSISLGLLLICVASCNNNRGNAISFAFNRPEHVAFACFAPYLAQTPEEQALRGQYAVLPIECCRQYDGSNSRLRDEPGTYWQPNVLQQQQCATVDNHALRTPALHALVTQSTRGEVAAVDLAANDVLDSDRQVPGFTFLDSGGLPSGVVVPPWQPHGGPNMGPSFVYVASAEEFQLRAIPTCRFRSGSACGPDLHEANRVDRASYTARQRVPLWGAPADLLYGPDQALWTSLPELGLLMRVGIPTLENGGLVDPFEIATPATPEAPRLPAQPKPFVVPAPGALTMPEPVLEQNEYLAACGLEAPFKAARLNVPNAPRVPIVPTAQPDQLRYDAESGLLFVSDRESPVLHVFRLDVDGTLTTLGALPTGQPVREFVITPRVPPLAQPNLLAAVAPAEDPAADTKRYLYAIDALGTVMVFDFVVDAVSGQPSLTPLLVPAPGTRYADRIPLDGLAATLEVVDTRTQSDYQCGQESIDALMNRRSEIAAMPQPLSTEVSNELSRIDWRISIYNNAESLYLRGVFVVVATLEGTMSVIDVHDMDTLCRAQKFCCAAGPTGANGVPTSCIAVADDEAARANALLAPRSPEAQNSLAVRRHTLRRRTASRQVAEPVTASALQRLTCDANIPQSAVELDPNVCGPADPWTALSESWRIDWEGSLPNSRTDGVSFEAVPDRDDWLAVVAPAEFDFCARGVEVGDLVAVVGRAPDALRGQCPDPSVDEPPLFKIEEATSTRLLVSARPEADSGQSPAVQGARMLACYPDFAGIDLRAGGYLVVGSGGTYLHRVIADQQGRCVTDQSKDPLLDARMRRSLVRTPAGDVETQVFRNPYVTFALAPLATGVPQETAETSITVSETSVPLQRNIAGGSSTVPDARPSALRYVPQVGHLFVLDSAGQGLRRYGTSPFEPYNEVFR